MANPFKGFLDLKRSELPLAAAMFAYFFLVITTFWILKPIKKTLFIGFYKAKEGGFSLFGEALTGSQAELVAKVLNMGVAFFAVVAFSLAARKLRREQLTYVFAAFSALALLSFNLVGVGGELSVWLFYLFGDLFNTLMVATFFAFLSDSFTASGAKRAYGPIVLGGVCGGAFGSMFVRAQIKSLDIDAWVWIAISLTVLIVVVATIAGAHVRKTRPAELDREPANTASVPKIKPDNPALAGAKLVARSRYLMAIVVMVGVYEIVSTIVDFQFTATIEALVPADEQGAAFSTVYMVTNLFAMVFQLFFTTAVLRKWGVKGALLVMPVVVAASSMGYLVVPAVALAGLLSAGDNGLSYSLNQSAREALYTVTTREEKYQAKAFIDMFVQRFAKAVAVGVSLAVTLIFTDFSSVRWLSVITIAGAVVWFLAARYAGRQFEAHAEQEGL